MSKHIRPMSPEVIKAMYDWLTDCEWPDIDSEEILELTPGQIAKAVNRLYCGGIDAFIQNNAG